MNRCTPNAIESVIAATRVQIRVRCDGLCNRTRFGTLGAPLTAVPLSQYESGQVEHMRRHWSHRALRRLRDVRGANLVEAAFMTPLLLLLTFGMVDFASVLYVYLALENGVTQASRYGVTGSSMGSMTRDDSIRTAMRNSTPSLTLPDAAFTFSHLPVGGSTWQAGSGGPNEISKVSVNYTWDLMTPVIGKFFSPSGQINITVESSMKNEPFVPPTP